MPVTEEGITMSTAQPHVRRAVHPSVLVESDVVVRASARRWLAATRLALGFVFLWAFLDKLFGLHYATGALVDGTRLGEAWVSGGSPTAGFLAGATGPFAGFFGWLNPGVADWLFMLALLGVGVGLLTGAGVYLSAGVGTLLLVLMWLAVWPPQQGSNNPVVDDHVVYALVLITLAVTRAGDTWGVGRRWAETRAVRRWPVLR